MPDSIDGNTATTPADNGDRTTTTGTTGAEDALFVAPEATVPSLSLARHLPTALARTPLNGREWVAVTTLMVIDKCDKMGEVARKLTDALRDVRKDRDQMVERINVLEQELKDQAIEFENRERQQMLILEAKYGGKEMQEPLVPRRRYGC
jgi:hypothetical protein